MTQDTFPPKLSHNLKEKIVVLKRNMSEIKIEQIREHILLLEIGKKKKSSPFNHIHKLSFLQPIFDAIEREIGGGQVIMMSNSSQ